MIDANKAVERARKQYQRQNEWNKENRDRIGVLLPKGTKERIKAITGMSISSYIVELVLKDLEQRENKAK